MSRVNLMRPRRLVVAAALVAAATLVSGCQQSPGVAARVGDQTISTDDVDLLATAMCSERETLAKQGQPAAATRRDVRQNALLSLITAKQAAAYAKRENISVKQSEINRALGGVDQYLVGVAEQERPRLRELIGELFVEQAQMAQIGAAEADPQDPSAAVTAGRQVVQQSGAAGKVQVNPRFSSEATAQLGATDAELSLPVGREARDLSSGQADAESVAALPANLRCG